MLIKVIQNFTRALGAPRGWNPQTDGKCSVLPILDHVDQHGNASMISCWEPTPAELEALNNGGLVFLRVLGEVHPPVGLWVE